MCVCVCVHEGGGAERLCAAMIVRSSSVTAVTAVTGFRSAQRPPIEGLGQEERSVESQSDARMELTTNEIEACIIVQRYRLRPIEDVTVLDAFVLQGRRLVVQR